MALIKERTPNAKVIAVRADVAAESEIKALVDKAVAEYGRLDVMVSIAVIVLDFDPSIRWDNRIFSLSLSSDDWMSSYEHFSDLWISF